MNVRRIQLPAAALVAVLIAACSSTPGEQKKNVPPDILAIQDYIVVAQLPEVRRIRTDRHETFQELDNNRYVIFRTRREYYLLEFRRNCWELRDNFDIKPDVRVEDRSFYPGVDTLRGCPTGRAYQLNEGQAEEIRNLGDAPTGG